ncbi:hypothetical protein TRAPUB_7158 [Trametes pubescens]|uniref:Uncharacterized protein n=1 Tax=Trametes pubescens TaxID=154538 RepID=A0A1M2V408_TRAPU|nr:hypothetical protein TRAPUB_7158 [Trametes pubescens]
MTHIPTGPGQSFSIPLAPPSPSLASPSSTSTTVLDSPHPYLASHYRRASQGPGGYGTPKFGHWDIDRDDKQIALIESLNRNVTVVFWYKANAQPLRLHQEIQTFPFFSFSALTEIVEHLRLTDRTYLDWYNVRTSAWEQQQVSFVRRISEVEERLLYRVRHNLFEPLRDEECPGLEAEIKLQRELSMRVDASPASTPRKRPADQPLSPPVGKHHRSISMMQNFASPYTAGSPPASGGLMSPLPTNLGSPAFVNSSLPNTSPNSPQSAHLGMLPGTLDSPQRPPLHALPSHSPSKNVEISIHDISSSTSTASTSMSSTSERPIPQAPEDLPVPRTPSSLATALLLPPLAALPQPQGPGVPRKWPNDFFVYEIAAGLRDMERLAGAEPALKQDEVFRRAFGVAYVKSTFCRHRALWRSAGAGVRGEYEEMGRDPRACWGEFARHVEGREEGKRRARKGRGKAGEEGGDEGGLAQVQAQERMMTVIGMPLPMIMASLPGQAGGAAGVGMGSGSGARSASGAVDARGQLHDDDDDDDVEPVMGSLRPPEEVQVQQKYTFLVTLLL